MRCRKTEKLLSKAVDGRLNPKESRTLETHIESCPKCRLLAEEYRGMLDTLRSEPFPEAPPYFLQRLLPRLDQRPSPAWLPIGKQLGLRAIPLALLIFAVLASASLFFLPEQPDQLSQSAALLRNENLLEESLSLAAGGSDNPNIQLIFNSLDLNSQRRFP